MNQAISPYGYSDNEIGNIAAIGVVGGTFGCCKFKSMIMSNSYLFLLTCSLLLVISGPVIDKTKQHKILLKIMAPLMLSTYVAFIFVGKAKLLFGPQ